jgi:medium-chain acyl-[acyl-carrier-protein] hydrolase
MGIRVRRHVGARLRLYCFPFAGVGSWHLFRSWAAELPADLQRDVELWSVDARQDEDAGSPATDLHQLVGELLATADPGAEPYAFFGHSMGALVSFELARALRERGRPGPVHLVVSGHRAPQLPDPHPPVHALPESEIIAKLRRLEGSPPEVLGDPDLMELFLPRLRADLAACETYTYESGPPLPCSLTALGGAEDPEVGRKDLLAWREQVNGAFSLHFFPGGHFFPQNAQELVLRVLAQDLRRVLRRIP